MTDKLIHNVNSSTANLTCILTNGIAYQFVNINSHEGWICSMYREHCYSTRWTFSSCPIYFVICNVMYGKVLLLLHLILWVTSQGLELFTWSTSTQKYKYPDTEIVCNTFLIMTDPINHLYKVSERRFFFS